MHTDLADFEIWIASPEVATPGARYATRVVQSPAGPAVSEFTLDVNDAAFQQELTVVRSIDPALAARSTFGEKLFELLFAGDVERVWRESQGRVAAGRPRVYGCDCGSSRQSWRYCPGSCCVTRVTKRFSRSLPTPSCRDTSRSRNRRGSRPTKDCGFFWLSRARKAYLPYRRMKSKLCRTP